MIGIETKKVPHSFRNKYLRNSGSGSFSTSMFVPPVNGAEIEMLKADDVRPASDTNVFSSLRSLLEIKSRIIALTDEQSELTSDNTLSSLRALKETQDIVDREILKALDKAESLFLFKTKNDRTTGHLAIEGGVTTDLLQSSQLTPGTLGSGYLIKYNPDTGKSYIEVDELYVRLKAIFDSLETRKSTHIGGQQIQTPASIECTKVELLESEDLCDLNNARLFDAEGNELSGSVSAPVYRCYFLADDGEKAIVNEFASGDFAQSRKFNIKPGIYENVSNRYYWRYVVAVGDNYIDLSVTDCDKGSDIPEAGDTIIQLGNRTDANRQNAIITSAYGETAPSRQMLAGINSYSLADKVVIEEGFDKLTNQAYTKTFGYSYIGAKDRSSYMEYAQDRGLEIRGAIKGVSDDGNSVYELMPDGTSFFGITNSETKKKTGIIQGVDCMVAGKKRTGIFSVVDDDVVFEMDPINKKYKFTGEVNATSGIFNDVYVKGLYFEKWSVIDNPGSFVELQFLSPNILITGSKNSFNLYLRIQYSNELRMDYMNPYFYKVYNTAAFICSMKLISSDSTFKVFYKNGEVKDISALNLNEYTFAELMFIPKRLFGTDMLFYSGDWFVMNYTSFNAILLGNGKVELTSKPMA